MLRLQGFPDTFKIACSYTQTRKQLGNSLPVPVAQAIIENVFKACGWAYTDYFCETDKLIIDGQLRLCEKEAGYGEITKAEKRRKIQNSLPAQ